MTAFHHHHERHPTDTTTCHSNFAIGFLLGNCPFDALAQKHRTLLCGLRHDFVQGIADGTGCAGRRRDSPPTRPRTA